MNVSEPLSGSSSSREQKPAQSGRNSMIGTIQRIMTMLIRTWKHQIIFLMTFLLKAITSDYCWCGYWTLLILDWVSMFSHPDLPYPFLSLWLLWNFCLWIRIWICCYLFYCISTLLQLSILFLILIQISELKIFSHEWMEWSTKKWLGLLRNVLWTKK